MAALIRLLTIVGAVSLLPGLVGCRSTPATPTNAGAAGAVPPFTVLSSEPATNAIEGLTRVMGPGGGMTYREIRNDELTDAREVHRAETSDRSGATHVIHLGDRQSQYWNIHDDGIVMTAVVDHDENALTMFRPSLPVGQRIFQPEPEAIEAQMRVVQADNPRRRRESGTATQRARYAANERIRTPDGTFDVIRIDIEFTADLRMADVRSTTRLWLEPELGCLAREESRRLSVLGVPGRTTTRLFVRELSGDQPGD